MKKFLLMTFLITVTTTTSMAQLNNGETNLTGSWQAIIEQEFREEPVKYPMNCVIVHGDAGLTGQLIFVVEDFNTAVRASIDKGFRPESDIGENKVQRLDFEGKIVNKLFHLNYSNRNIPQFGSMLLEVKSNDLLQGRFLGYGPESNRMIAGLVTFRRK